MKRHNDINPICRKCGHKRTILPERRREKGHASSCFYCLAQWRKNNREKIKKQCKKNLLLLKLEIFNHYCQGKIKCQCPSGKCGENRFEFLSIDHIGGGGTKHRKEIKGGEQFYRWIRRNGFPEGLRILCHNCNMSLGFYGYCPHQNAPGREFKERVRVIDIIRRLKYNKDIKAKK